MSAIAFLIAVGIDIAKARFDAARLGADGKRKHKKFDNAPEGFALFAGWLAGFGPEAAHLRMEATGAYSVPLADFLAARGFHVSVVNPAKIAAFAKSELSRAKTDKADAKLIARYALAMRPDAWMPPPAEIRELQVLLRRLEHLLEMQRMEQNREDTADPAVAGSIRAVLATLEAEIKAVRKAVRRHIDGDPGLKRRAGLLESIPGVGAATAAWLLALLGEHRGFDGPKQAGPSPGWPRGCASRASGPGRPASPRPVTRCCARPCTCPCFPP
jgi:transposase